MDCSFNKNAIRIFLAIVLFYSVLNRFKVVNDRSKMNTSHGVENVNKNDTLI